jgi:hypothetical protein
MQQEMVVIAHQAVGVKLNPDATPIGSEFFSILVGTTDLG